MLRVNSLLRHLSLNGSKCGSSGFSLEFVRWRRKPRWLPVAKSKLFRIPERKQQNADERAELIRLHNHYRVQMRSVRLYLREEQELNKEISTADHIVMTPEEEEAEFQRCIDENNIWNERIASERAQRLKSERENKATYIKERLELAQIRKEERLENIEAAVRRKMELGELHITREKLDDAIKQILANPIDYNFAIDLQGNIHKGRSSTVENGKTPSEKKLAYN